MMNLSKIIRGSKKPNDLVDAVYQAKEKSLKETTRQDSYTKFFRTPQEKRERKLQKINKKFQYYFEHSNQNPNVEFFKKKKKKKNQKKKQTTEQKKKDYVDTVFDNIRKVADTGAIPQKKNPIIFKNVYKK